MEGAKLTMRYLEELGAEDCCLWPEEPEELCSPVVYGRLKSRNPYAKTLILYCMYDVMPIEPTGWKFPPFEARIVNAEEIDLPAKVGKVVVARGAENQKGPGMSALNGIKAMLDATGDVPVNVIFVIEGEEERSSFPTLERFRDAYMDELKRADAVYFPETSHDPGGTAQITLGRIGIMHVMLEVEGGDWGGPTMRDLNSSDGVWVDAPVDRLIKALATFKDEKGDIAIEGFYEDLKPLIDEEKELIERMKETMSNEELKDRLGVRRFKGGKQPLELLEEQLSKPSLNINALDAGFAGPTYKVAGEIFYSTFTKMPARVTARVDIRYVPELKPNKMLRQIRGHLDQQGFSMVKVKLMRPPTRPWVISVKEPLAQAAIKAAKIIGKEVTVRPRVKASSGMHLFTKAQSPSIPGVEGEVGFGGRPHSQNEFISVEGIRKHAKWTAAFYYELSRTL